MGGKATKYFALLFFNLPVVYQPHFCKRPLICKTDKREVSDTWKPLVNTWAGKPHHPLKYFLIVCETVEQDF